MPKGGCSRLLLNGDAQLHPAGLASRLLTGAACSLHTHTHTCQAREAYAAFLQRVQAGYQPDRVQDGALGCAMRWQWAAAAAGEGWRSAGQGGVPGWCGGGRRGALTFEAGVLALLPRRAATRQWHLLCMHHLPTRACWCCTSPHPPLRRVWRDDGCEPHKRRPRDLRSRWGRGGACSPAACLLWMSSFTGTQLWVSSSLAHRSLCRPSPPPPDSERPNGAGSSSAASLAGSLSESLDLA